MRGLSIASVLCGCTLPAPVREVDLQTQFDAATDTDPAWSWGEEVAVHQADASVMCDAGDYGGSVLFLVGDVNGDRIDDVMVSCAFTDPSSGSGRLYLLYG